MTGWGGQWWSGWSMSLSEPSPWVWLRDGVDRLFVRHRDSFDATEIAGTETASVPAISPDGRSVAFSTSSKLAKVSIDGGPVTILADTVEARGVSWDQDDSILAAEE